MKQKLFSLLAVLAAIIFFPSFVWAQPDGGTDGSVIVVEDDDADDADPPCPTCDEVVKAAVDKCEADWNQKCPQPPTPTTPKKVSEPVCGDGATMLNGACVCKQKDHIRLLTYFQGVGTWVCLPNGQAYAKLIMDVELLKKAHTWAAGQIDDLYRRIEELAQSDRDLAKALGELGTEVGLLDARLTSLEVWRKSVDARLGVLEGRVDELDPLARSGSIVEVLIGAEGMGVFRPGVDPGFALLQSSQLYVRFDKESHFWLGGGFYWGGYFNEGTGGPSWLLSESLGLRISIDDAAVHNLHLDGRAFQVFAGMDKGAGYQDVLNDPQLGYYMAGQIGYTLQPVDYFFLGANGFVGGGVGNYFAGPGDLREAGGPFGGVSLNLGFRIGYAPVDAKKTEAE